MDLNVKRRCHARLGNSFVIKRDHLYRHCLCTTLKETKNEVCKVLKCIIKKSLETRQIPKDWKVAHIMHICI